MTERLPRPLTPEDCDCTDLDGFMLNVERLLGSELVALSSHEVIGAAVLVWSRAWKQRPAASIPDDDKVIAAFARMKIGRYRKLKEEILRGFVKCSDGRLYHKVLAVEAVNAFGRKQAFRKKREADAERLRHWRKSRGETGDETHSETRFRDGPETLNETRFVAEGQGQGQGQKDSLQGGKNSEGNSLAVGADPSPDPAVAAGKPRVIVGGKP